MIERPTLAALAASYLERQRWFIESAAGEARTVELVDVEELSDGQPGLARLSLQSGGRRLQLFVGWRRAAALQGALRNEEAAVPVA